MHIEYWIHTTVRIMAGSKLKADMVEALWLFLKCLDIEQLQIALENANVTPNMFMPPEPMEPSFSKYNKYSTLLNWACYNRFHEGIALLMLKGGGTFLQSKMQILIKPKKKIFPSAIATVFRQQRWQGRWGALTSTLRPAPRAPGRN